MSGPDRRQQVLAIAAEQFANGGLHGAWTEVIARKAEITQPYVFRMFGTKKALFLEVVLAAFDRTTEAMRDAAGAVRVLHTGLPDVAGRVSRREPELRPRADP